MPRRKDKGFALKELLICVGIVALLASLTVMPYLKDHHQRAGCLAAHRQWAMALIMYTLDWDGCLPPVTTAREWVRVDEYNWRTVGPKVTWVRLVLPHVQKRPQCLLCQKPSPSLNPKYRRACEYQGMDIGLCYNQLLENKFYADTRAFVSGAMLDAKIVFPSVTLLTGDCRYGKTALKCVDLWKTKCSNFIEPCLTDELGGTRHNEGATYSFVDGHAKWLRPKQIKMNRESTQDISFEP